MNIIFLGPQGSGKTTQAKMLAEHLGLPYIEMGQLFRDRANEDSEVAKQIKSALNSGELVPDEIAVKALHEKLARQANRAGFVLDGYPRNQAQMEGLTTTIDKVFYVKVPDEESISRLLKRGRADDTEEALKRRLQIYHEKTEPLLSQFRTKNLLVEIDGQPAVEDVNRTILEKMNEQ